MHKLGQMKNNCRHVNILFTLRIYNFRCLNNKNAIDQLNGDFNKFVIY